MNKKFFFIFGLLVLAALFVASCATSDGLAGPRGAQGPAGPQGEPGPAGEVGALTEEQVAALETSAALGAIQFPSLDEVRRGCPACHELVDAETGKYTLPYEAHERVEVRGEEHPSVAPDGTS
ncbi:MAG: collagen-like protein, partial [Anaerolineales bacterium]